jgi:hypothetical protein
MRPTPEDAAALTSATRGLFALSSAEQGHWPPSVEVREIGAHLEDGQLAVRVRYTRSTHPDLELGARFEVGSTFWTERGVDAEWAASHVVIHFSEATFAGGDPSTNPMPKVSSGIGTRCCSRRSSPR